MVLIHIIDDFSESSVENIMHLLEEEIIRKDLMIETLKMRVELTDKQIEEFNQTIDLFKSKTKSLENELNSAKDKVFYFDITIRITINLINALLQISICISFI
jgi:predicted  nucleic acid-binding Zn-ribbon protein